MVDQVELFAMPILGTQRRETLTFVPTAEDRRWSEKNYYQTLERIRERGGFGWCELAAVLEHRPWHSMDKAEAQRVCERIAASRTPTTPERSDG